MSRKLWGAVVMAVVFAAGLLAMMACDNESSFEAQIDPQLPKGTVKVKAHVYKNKQSGTFNFDGQKVSITCKISLTGIADGQPFSKIVTVTMSSTGAKGAKYEMDCTDPLAVQFPADAHNFVASYTADDGSTGGLPITSGLRGITTGPGTMIKAETGQQIVLLTFPDKIPDGGNTLSLDFDLNTSRSIDVKTILTGKVVCGSKTYYPPIVPDVTSLATVPALTIPVSLTPQPIPLPLDTVTDPVLVTIDCR